jgi:hypothetical protein
MIAGEVGVTQEELYLAVLERGFAEISETFRQIEAPSYLRCRRILSFNISSDLSIGAQQILVRGFPSHCHKRSVYPN